MSQEVDYDALSEDDQKKRSGPLAKIAGPTSNSVLLTSVTSTVITSNSQGAITTGNKVVNRMSEDSIQKASPAEDVLKATQDTQKSLTEARLKA
jgi:hypothetical protein